VDEQETYEYIEAYLQQSMNQEQQSQFEERLKKDPDFAIEFQLHKQLHAEFGASKLNDFRMLLREEANGAGKAHGGIVRKLNIRQVLSIAASGAILVLAGVYYLTNRSFSPQSLYAQYVDQPALSFDSGRQRGEEQTNLDLLRTTLDKAEDLYENDNYAAAIELLETMEKPVYRGFENDIYLRLAIYNLLNDDAQNAIRYFDQISELSESVRWYKSLAFLKLGDTAAVSELLSPLASYDNPKQKEAQRILKKIQ
jgi:hypothetical protein